MYNFLSFSLYSSCILLTIKRPSVVPLPGIKPNCISFTTTNALILFSNTLSTIFIPCTSNFTLFYALHFFTSPYPLYIGTITLVFQSSRIPFPLSTLRQSFITTSSPTFPLAFIISMLTSESPDAFPNIIFFIALVIFSKETSSTGSSTMPISVFRSHVFSLLIVFPYIFSTLFFNPSH